MASRKHSLADSVAIAFAMLRVLVQLSAIRPYGWFRDELYYLACADHPAWGYVDHPPLSVIALKIWRAVFGDSIVSVRLVPALLEAGVVYFAVLTARAIGAKTPGAVLTGVAVLCAPGYLAFGHYYSMNAWDHLFWAATGYLAVRIASTPLEGSLWIRLGVVLGLGALNKWSIAWLAPGLALGLFLTPARKALRTKWPYVTVLIGGVLVLPHVLWEIHNGWPTLEFMHNALSEKYVERSLPKFLAETFLISNPISIPLAILGILAPFRGNRAATPLAVISIVSFVVVGSSKSGKAEYLLATMPLLFASGASLFESKRKATLLAVPLAIVALIVLPLALPVLSESSFIRYQASLGIKPASTEKKELAALPQFYADMHGWPELADAARLAWNCIPETERAHAKIWAVSGGYGPAAAIDHFGPAHAIASHNSYWTWGYGDDDRAAPVVLLGGSQERLESIFETVELVTVFECDLCMPYENHKSIWIGRGLRSSWPEIWEKAKHYE